MMVSEHVCVIRLITFEIQLSRWAPTNLSGEVGLSGEHYKVTHLDMTHSCSSCSYGGGKIENIKGREKGREPREHES